MSQLNITTEERFWSKVNKNGPVYRSELGACWEWIGGRNNHGYGRFRLSNPRTMIYAHRYSYILEYGELEGGMGALHKCDNPPCVRPSHLFKGDKVDNSRDAAIKRRINTAKLTPEQVVILKELVNGHKTYGMTKYLSEEFGVHRSTIRRAVKDITFKSLSD